MILKSSWINVVITHTNKMFVFYVPNELIDYQQNVLSKFNISLFYTDGDNFNNPRIQWGNLKSELKNAGLYRIKFDILEPTNILNNKLDEYIQLTNVYKMSF